MLNYTISGNKDGFGSQYGKILSGFAFCQHHKEYRYIHTGIKKISHGLGEVLGKVNEFIGIPIESTNIDMSERYNKEVSQSNEPSLWYDEKTLEKIRHHYWSTPKPPRCKQDIVVHIRRGDVQASRGPSRYIANEWYNDRIPWVASKYPDDYTIAIHSEGEMGEFESIMAGWPNDLIDRVIWKLGTFEKSHMGFDSLTAFHEMVTAKVLLQSKSALSYVAGILSRGDVLSLPRYAAPLNHWYFLGPGYSFKKVKYDD